MEYLVNPLPGLLAAGADFSLNVCSPPSPPRPATVIQVGVISPRFRHGRHDGFSETFVPAFDHHVALGEVLQKLRKPSPAVQRRTDLVGVGAGELEKHVCANCENGGAHRRRVLLHELVGRYHGGPEFSGLREKRVEARSFVRHKILDLVAVQCEQLTEKAISSAGLNSLSISKISDVHLPVPSPVEQQEIVRRVWQLFSLSDRIEARFESACAQIRRLIPSLSAKAFRGELVPTEAGLAEAEGREFESAEVLLGRIHGEKTKSSPDKLVKRINPKPRAHAQDSCASTESSTDDFGRKPKSSVSH
jgi:hypothetical protein